MVVDHMLMLTVRLAQARWAQYLLMREGVPIEYGMVDERLIRQPHSTRKGSRTRPARVSERWFADLLSWLGL
jgi:hypothetical protein